VLQDNEGQVIGFRLRQQKFTTPQAIINFVNLHENIVQLLGGLEELMGRQGEAEKEKKYGCQDTKG
jgi:hypothetical protein